MSESMRNIRFVEGLNPNPKYKKETPIWFVEKYCKLAFPCPDGRSEYMWVKVGGFAKNSTYELCGSLNNDPVYATNFQDGDEVEFNRDEIIDVIE